MISTAPVQVPSAVVCDFCGTRADLVYYFSGAEGKRVPDRWASVRLVGGIRVQGGRFAGGPDFRTLRIDACPACRDKAVAVERKYNAELHKIEDRVRAFAERIVAEHFLGGDGRGHATQADLDYLSERA